MRGISWLAAKPISFSRRTLLHGVSKYGTTVVNAVRRWPKRRYTAHDCTLIAGYCPVWSTADAPCISVFSCEMLYRCLKFCVQHKLAYLSFHITSTVDGAKAVSMCRWLKDTMMILMMIKRTMLNNMTLLLMMVVMMIIIMVVYVIVIMTLMMTKNVENIVLTSKKKTEGREPSKRTAFSCCPFKTFVPNKQI